MLPLQTVREKTTNHFDGESSSPSKSEPHKVQAPRPTRFSLLRTSRLGPQHGSLASQTNQSVASGSNDAGELEKLGDSQCPVATVSKQFSFLILVLLLCSFSSK